MEAHATEAVLTALQPTVGSAGEHRKINVLFLMIPMAMGGSERLVYNLARSIDRRVFAPSIAWFLQEEPLKEFVELGIPLHHVPKRSRFDWKAMRQLGRIVRRHQIDIINAHHFMSAFYAYYAARVANRAALVYTEHSQADVLSATGKWRLIGKHLARSCDAVIGISDGVSQTLASHFEVTPQRLHAIPNGVDVDLFGSAAEQRDAVRERLGFAPDDVVIGHVANFRRNKNHLFLLRAFRKLVERRRNARLVIVGEEYPDDPETSKAAVLAYVREHGLGGHVRLLGYQPDVQNLLAMMDVFSLVSYKEGLPLSLIEAMASGLPVVGTDVEGIREVIRPEANGLLVVPDDDNALERALNRLLANAGLRRTFGAASRRIAREGYAFTRCVRHTEQVFREVLGQTQTVSPPILPSASCVSTSTPPGPSTAS